MKLWLTTTILWANLSTLAFGDGASAAAPEPEASQKRADAIEVIGTADLVSEHRFANQAEKTVSSVVDVAWAGERSIYVLRFEDGVRRHALERELVGGELVLPGKDPRNRLEGGTFLAADDDWVVQATPNALLFRTAAASSSEFDARNVRLTGGGFGALDVAGDSVVALGYPRGTDYQASPETLLWSADLSKGLTEWQPLHEFAGAKDRKYLRSMQNAMRMWGASLCTLADGKIFVYPSFPAQAMRFSAAGELERTWELPQLRRDEGRLDSLEEDPSNDTVEKLAAAWFNGTRVVDDCLALGKSPALVVREMREDMPEWFIVVLDSDEGSWYLLPFRPKQRSSWHLKGDANERGDIILVSTVRGQAAKEGGGGESLWIVRLP